jgi:branched-chain amino acid transport system ATP-binding protein
MALVVARGLSKSFRGIHAVIGLDLEIDDSIVGLIGPNGAGKTTAFNLLSGYYRPDAGEIYLNDRRIDGLPSHRVAGAGIARTFQIPRPFPDLSVRRNVATAALLRAHTLGRATGIADGILIRLGLSDQAERPARELGVAYRKRVEVAKALALEPRVLLLDEVFSGLNPTEMDELLAIVRDIHASGIAILLVEHVLSVVMRLCSRVIVMDQGRQIAMGTPEEIVRDPATIEAYLGLPLPGHEAQTGAGAAL